MIKERVEFETEKRLFLEEKHKYDALIQNDENQSGIFRVNVGGRVFTTYKSTLNGHDNSLSTLLTSKNSFFPRDKDGNIFIDRNPEVFSQILEYFRTNIAPDYSHEKEKERIFLQDLDFYLQNSPLQTSFQWSQSYKSPGLTISENGKSVEVTGEDGDHLIIIGDQRLTHGIHSVTLRVAIPRPNRYTLGVLPQLPAAYNRGFGYKTGVLGLGLHDHQSNMGIYCQTQLVASATSGYQTNDLVTMTVDVDRGNLYYAVNGIKCAELLDCDLLKAGVYFGVTLFNKRAVWRIISKD